MTLATRCPACGTIFRVVQDQLRVSQGWVRCGRCSEAFNALESMVEFPPPRLAMPAGAAAPASAAAPTPEPMAPSSTATPSTATAPAGDPAATSAAPPSGPVPPPADSLPAPAVPPAAAPGAVIIDVPPGVEMIATDGAIGLVAPQAADRATDVGGAALVDEGALAPDSQAAPLQHAAVATASSPDAAMPEPEPPGRPAGAVAAQAHAADEAVLAEGTASTAAADVMAAVPGAPSFIVAADRAARWRRPWVRATLSVLALTAALALLAQFAHAWRDRLAAQYPALRPWLAQGCALLACRVGEYRQIDALTVESSGLVRVEGSPVHRLSVTLRNRSSLEVAAPALDLSLNDAQGRPLARRVLQMSDLELPLRTIRPGSEVPIQVPLSIGDRQVSGYTVEIFYP